MKELAYGAQRKGHHQWQLLAPEIEKNPTSLFPFRPLPDDALQLPFRLLRGADEVCASGCVQYTDDRRTNPFTNNRDCCRRIQTVYHIAPLWHGSPSANGCGNIDLVQTTLFKILLAVTWLSYHYHIISCMSYTSLPFQRVATIANHCQEGKR